MRIAIIGANGQLGTDLREACSAAGHEVVPLTHKDITVEDESSVRDVLRSVRPAAVLNTAAFHNVPKCEEDPVRSFRVNGAGPLYVARVTQELGAVDLYYSTDYVFDGALGRPYLESDLPHPLNVYAVTKLAGEHVTLACCSRSSVVRISGIYGRVPCRAKNGNFITTVIRNAREKPEVRVVQDEVLAPTPTAEIAVRTVEILERGVFGIVHLASAGSCSWFEFAAVIFKTLGISTPLSPCSVHDFPSPVKRPFYSVLESRRASEAGISPMPHWREGLERFLRQQYPRGV